MVKQVSLVLGTLAVVGGTYGMSGSLPRASSSQEPKPALVLRVNVGEHSPALLKVRSGEQALLGLADGTRLALSPVLNDGVVELVVRDAALSVESEGQVFMIRLAGSVIIDAVHAVSVEWLGLDGSAPKETLDDEPCKTCCVTCEGVTLCACEVLMSCGHCCCAAACTCEWGSGR